MKTTDFSTPRRMSKSAFVIIFINSLRGLSGLFLIIFVSSLFKIEEGKSLMKVMAVAFGSLSAFVAIAMISSFINYYFKKFYVKDGNLIFTHGFLSRETTNIPLNKIYSLRTKQGFMYRILDMRGVSFDTLASKQEEIELILDEDDWKALFVHIEEQEQSDKQTEKNDCKNTRFNNLNLVKGALCQNHLRGMTVLLGVLGTFYNNITAVSDKAINYMIDYVDTHADYLSFSAYALITAAMMFYLLIMVLWIIKVFLRYYNMELKTDNAQLSFESGLITRFSSRFTYDKVCTLYVKQNIFEKWMNCCTIMLKQAVNATEKGNDCDVKIYGSNSAKLFLTWWLGEDYASSQQIFSARSGNGLFGYTIRYDLLVSLPAAIILYYFGMYVWMALPAVYIATALIKGAFAVHRSKITLREDYIEISNGKYADVKNFIKYNNIEVVRLVRTPFTPIYHRVNLVISTNGTYFTVRSLKEEEALYIYELLLHRK